MSRPSSPGGRPSSAAEQSMPLDSTLRMTVSPMVNPPGKRGTGQRAGNLVADLVVLRAADDLAQRALARIHLGDFSGRRSGAGRLP